MKSFNPTRVCGALICVLMWVGTGLSFGDSIVTTNHKVIRGLIREENDYYVKIDVKGVIIPIARGRIVSIKRLSPDDNARELRERAEVVVDRDVAAARVFVQQAQSLDPHDPEIVEALERLMNEITIREEHKSPEARRRLAEERLDAANHAFDTIHINEGYHLLIEALRADPEFEPAHRQIDEKFQRAPFPDTLLTAEYFADIVWPDHIRADSGCVALLPDVHADLVARYEKLVPNLSLTPEDFVLTGPDPEEEFQQKLAARRQRALKTAAQYARYIRTIKAGFARFPGWMQTVRMDADQRRLLEMPIEDLLGGILERNIDMALNNKMDPELYGFMFEKLAQWSTPQDSQAIMTLYARVWVGLRDFQTAQRELTAAGSDMTGGGDWVKDLAQVMGWLGAARDAEDNNDPQAAIEALGRVFAEKDAWVSVPEVERWTGGELARLRGVDLERTWQETPYWRGADIAAMMMAYDDDPVPRERAAAMFNRLLPILPWHLDLTCRLDGETLPIQEWSVQDAATNIAKPLALQFDQQSPFTLGVTIDMASDRPLGVHELKRFFRDGELTTISQTLAVKQVNFEMQASHPALGTLFRQTWSAPTPPPPAVMERLYAAGWPVTDQTTDYLYIARTKDVEDFLAEDLAIYFPPSVQPLLAHLSVPLLEQLLFTR